MSISHLQRAASTELPLLHAAVHWRVEPPFAPELSNWGERVDLMGRLAGTQLAYAGREIGFDIEEMMVSSTILSTAVTMTGESQDRFYRAIDQCSGVKPRGILTAYLCTGWGYALRYFMRHTNLKSLAISIVDVDLHNLDSQLKHPVIGPSGFGVTSLLFSLPENRQNASLCSGPYPNSAFNEFIVALKKYEALHGAQPTFIPFIQEPLAGAAVRTLDKETLGPNRNAEYGHCFGADPWIGVIEWLDAARPCETVAVRVGAIGFNGNYTIASIAVEPRTLAEFSRFEGRHDTLEQHISDHSNQALVPCRESTPQNSPSHPPSVFPGE